MPISAEQRQERQKWIGASDVAALVGVSPYKSSYDLWLEKTGRLDERAEQASNNDATEWGNRLEPQVLDRAESELGELLRNVRVTCPELRLAANLDAKVAKTGEPVEAKTTGIVGPVYGEWGEFGSGDVPQHVVIQDHAQAIALGHQGAQVERAFNPALIGQRGFGIYEVRISLKLMVVLQDRIADWWLKHVQGDTPPSDSMPSLEIARYIRREPGSVCDVPAQLIEQALDADARVKAAKQLAEKAMKELIAAMGDAESSSCGRVTYFEHTRKAHEVEASTFRVLRFPSKPKPIVKEN